MGSNRRDRSTRDYYECHAPQYNLSRFESKAGRWVDEVQKSILNELIRPPVQSVVLDVATGTGRIGVWLDERAERVIGVDLAFNMLREAKRRGDYDLVQAEGARLPLATDSVPLCVCVNALTLIPDYSRVLREVRRVLHPDGRLICNFANLFSYYFPFGLIATIRSKAFTRSVHSQWRSIFQLRRVFSDEGFQVEKMLGHVHLPNYLDNDRLLSAVRVVDSISRRSVLRYLCPSLFFELKPVPRSRLPLCSPRV